MIDENIQLLCVDLLHGNVLVSRVLVLEQELKDLFLVVDVANVEDGGKVPEEGKSREAMKGIVFS